VSIASKSDGLEFAERYDIEGKFRDARMHQVVSISTVLILSYL